jgi:hypothetical protein
MAWRVNEFDRNLILDSVPLPQNTLEKRENVLELLVFDRVDPDPARALQIVW